ncbi:MAG: phosphatidylserine decarboxylase [Lachnospiraceae bacterium]|nr:phosphatidylserine decarboxylase [Lachnospiraceae bacterium]
MRYRDRKGNTYIVDSGQERTLQLLYGTLLGRMLLKLLTCRSVSKLAGLWQSLPFSALTIDRFILENNIRMKDYIPTKYRTFNEFFARKIRRSRRPICPDKQALISPSDGKVLAFRIKDDLSVRIKNRTYTLNELFDGDEITQEFGGGFLYVIRLTVDNYHRYSYVDSGMKSENLFIKGKLHTVNPVALDSVAVFHENCREYTVIDGENIGRHVMMEVGAMLVGKIVNHHGAGRIKRGTEKGYFEFGGSTIVLLTKGDIVPDNDILFNTRKGIETLVKLGERIGHKKA